MLDVLEQAPVKRVCQSLVTKALKNPLHEASLLMDARTLPEVFKNHSGEDADYHWDLFLQLEKLGLVLINRSKKTGPCADYELSPKLSVKKEHFERLRLRMGLSLTPELSPAEEWRRALSSGLKAPAHVADALKGYHVAIPSKSPAEVVEGLNRLLQLKGQDLYLREASSLAFWSLSKVLDNRTDMVAKLFELDECPFPSAPLQVNVRLPREALRGALFIENSTTFEVLAHRRKAGTEGLALIYSAGARATAKRLTQRQHVSIFHYMDAAFSADKAWALEEFLFEGRALPAYFFGDLDYSGMQILKGLRSNFPGLEAWQPGYAQLLQRLKANDAHVAEAADKKGQKDPGETGCSYTDGLLLPALRNTELFVDQE